ncbi:hypothetical protein WICPIJ_008692 [Wickerhamomyces pijperi]|uniref:Uncharacterized protein n=1 Tax=Wickerhamomyces pijperi TaxID=599730 RepID=A0A9P8PVS9_WICPI|nr:hypothetical protein WICPIJ_008692 [Wickerhamomyces pijperi]
MEPKPKSLPLPHWNLGQTTSGGHESSVDEIRVTVMQLTTDLRQGSSEKSTECLFLTSGNITQDTRVFRENVFSGTDNGNRVVDFFVFSRVLQIWGIWVLVFNVQLFEFSQDRSDLQTFFQVVILVGIDQLDVFTTVENQSMVLVIGLTVTKNWVTRQLDSELWTTTAVLQDLTVTVNQGRVDSCVVHETRDSSVQSLGSQRSPDSGSQGVFRSSGLETNTVEWNFINLGFQDVFILFFFTVVIVSSSFFSQDLCVLDETVPFDWVQLLQVFQQSNTGELIVFLDDFSKGKQDLFGVVWHQDSEVFGFKVIVILGNEEGWGSQGSLTFNFRRNLVVKQLLDVVNGKQMFSVHRDDNGVPDLGDQDLWLVLDFHVGGGQDLGVDSLWQSGEDVSPWSQNGNTQVEGTTNGKDHVTDNVPQVGIQEEQDQVTQVHQTQGDSGLLTTQGVTPPELTSTSHVGGGQDSDWISQGKNQELVGFSVLGTKDNSPYDTFWVPEQLVDIIVTDNLVVVTFTLDVTAIDNFVDLGSDVSVQRSDDSVQVVTFRDWLDSLLTGWRIQVVQGTLEDETETFWSESDLVGFTPTQQVQSDMTDTFQWGQGVHLGLPLEVGRFQRVVTFQSVQGFFGVVGLLNDLLGLLGLLLGLSGLSGKLTKLHVSETNLVVKIQLGSKVPLLEVSRPRIQQGHEVVKHVSHRVSLKTKSIRQVDKDIFDLFNGNWSSFVSSPSWIWLVCLGCSMDLASGLGRIVVGIGQQGTRRSVSARLAHIGRTDHLDVVGDRCRTLLQREVDVSIWGQVYPRAENPEKKQIENLTAAVSCFNG